MAKSKPIRGIACDDKAAGAIRSVVEGRLDEMCALRDAALDWIDPEGVHDMRVASRRLRGALQDFSPYLRKVRLAPLLRDIKGIADSLGRVRDYDVAIMALEQIAANAPSEVAQGIQRFADFRRVGQSEARVKLMPSLEPSHLTQVKATTEESFERVSNRFTKCGLLPNICAMRSNYFRIVWEATLDKPRRRWRACNPRWEGCTTATSGLRTLANRLNTKCPIWTSISSKFRSG